ncbi:MAG: DDE-type integrase/transposase/recombinase [Candidatus Krumholzibacteriia bacterium]
MHDPWPIATWRFEQISPLLDPALTGAEKRRYIREKARQSIEWPHSGRRGARRPIARATLLRWLRSYQRDGLKGLLPEPRSRKKPDRSELVAYALALLVEEPERSLNQLLVYLKLQFPKQSLSRSTLQRELTRHSAYAGIVKRKPRKLRQRYETARPHECWQLDGKRFDVRFADGRRRTLYVLSILDDFSRFVLACVIALSESLAGTVRVARMAIERFGLPTRMQFDRGSAFDSKAFREGLALLGVHRNFVQRRAPESQGKIEAYHRVLKRWFVRELRYQQVHSLEHLEQLLWATIELFYNHHRHRELKTTPEQALAGCVSERRVGAEDLMRAFWARTRAKSHPKTGHVVLPNATFVVPARYAGKRASFRYDPVDRTRAVVVLDREHELALEPFVIKRAFASEPAEPPRGVGQLQKLLDTWRGYPRPNAQPGFGLPEVFTEIGRLLGHLVPQDEREARTIRDFYREFGPLHATHFRSALDATRSALGQGRALHVYLEHLARLIRVAQSRPESEDPQ